MGQAQVNNFALQSYGQGMFQMSAYLLQTLAREFGHQMRSHSNSTSGLVVGAQPQQPAIAGGPVAGPPSSCPSESCEEESEEEEEEDEAPPPPELPVRRPAKDRAQQACFCACYMHVCFIVV